MFSQPVSVLLAVGAGGACGALLRFFISQWLAVKPGVFPVATLTVNIIGAFLMGIGFYTRCCPYYLVRRKAQSASNRK